jgi:type III secretory pathway component EscU
MTINSLKYLGETKILMSSSLIILSLSISLLFNYGFGIIDYTSGQINTTQQLQQLQMNQNESHVNASQFQGNGSAW